MKFLSFVDNAKFKNMRKLEAALQEKMTSISDEKVQLSTFSSVISANANGSNIAINPEVIWGLNL